MEVGDLLRREGVAVAVVDEAEEPAAAHDEKLLRHVRTQHLQDGFAVLQDLAEVAVPDVGNVVFLVRRGVRERTPEEERQQRGGTAKEMFSDDFIPFGNMFIDIAGKRYIFKSRGKNGGLV